MGDFVRDPILAEIELEDDPTLAKEKAGTLSPIMIETLPVSDSVVSFHVFHNVIAVVLCLSPF